MISIKKHQKDKAGFFELIINAYNLKVSLNDIIKHFKLMGVKYMKKQQNKALSIY